LAGQYQSKWLAIVQVDIDYLWGERAYGAQIFSVSNSIEDEHTTIVSIDYAQFKFKPNGYVH